MPPDEKFEVGMGIHFFFEPEDVFVECQVKVLFLKEFTGSLGSAG